MNDKDFITSKFEGENVTAPESLNESNIKARLEQGTKAGDMIKLNKGKKRILKPVISVAACIAIVVGTFATANVIQEQKIEKNFQSQAESGIIRFTNYDELKAFSEKMEPDSKEADGILGHFGVKSLYEKSESAVDYETEKSDEVEVDSHSETYKQVDGVDEADIVKTDGKYIYVLDQTDNSVAVYSAKNGKAKQVSRKFFDSQDDNFAEMYLDGDYIYVVGDTYSDKREKAFVMTLNIADKKEIKVTDTYEQSGRYSTSRMSGGCVYLISTTYFNTKKFVPFCTNENGNYKKIPATDICAFECCQRPEYVIVGAVDTNSGKHRKTKTKAVMGGAENVYCNTEHLFIACNDYRRGRLKTQIIKYALDGVKIDEQATGSVNGRVLNQWAFDEKDGYLRVATTANNSVGAEINKLFVLDSNLKTVGSAGGYAKNEHIEAVRYIGDMAYVITYETTDPLFCIDLSNPKNPQITGEVKISGFSTNLVPIGKDKLMGIGHATEDTEWGEARNGVKLALFDISDKNNPKVLDEKVYKNCTSAAQSTHKAILQNSTENYLAIPMSWESMDESDTWYSEGGAVIFTEQNGKIKIIGEKSTGTTTDRLVYIGDTIYAVSAFENTVTPFTLD